MSDFFDKWNERIAFNEGYEAQKIKSANIAGRDAFLAGEDKADARSAYLDRDDSSSDVETLGMESVDDDMSIASVFHEDDFSDSDIHFDGSFDDNWSDLESVNF